MIGFAYPYEALCVRCGWKSGPVEGDVRAWERLLMHSRDAHKMTSAGGELIPLFGFKDGAS